MPRFGKRMILAALLATTVSMVAAGPVSAGQTCIPLAVATICQPS